MNRSPIDLCMAAVQLVQRKPRTREELAKLLGATPDQAGDYLKAMREEGLVTSVRRPYEGKRGQTPIVWTWVREDGQ